jgi:hypothetical protein
MVLGAPAPPARGDAGGITAAEYGGPASAGGVGEGRCTAGARATTKEERVSPRYERLLFRFGLVGIVLLAGAFVYRTVVNPPGPDRVRVLESTTTEAPEETTTTTTAPAPAQFRITSPLDQTVVFSSEVVITGVGTPTATVAAGDAQTTVGEEGVWALRVALEEGANVITLVQTSADGSQVGAVVTIVYDDSRR